ncbi:MAG: hypothetical protein K0Q95_431 [Bacteroidota bacterium]|jgi:hypothetical protein|nr:hypothetical protein [Bacteroidota bacterium]
MNKTIDFFISHASEDKQDIVKQLADNLIINGATVFYDEYSIKLGDSISDSINKGLTVSKHAIVILSKFFFEKGWTNAELQAIFSKSLAEKYKILIIYHKVTHNDVIKIYPLLADKKAIDSSIGVEKITEALFTTIQKPFNLTYLKHKIDRSRSVNEGFSVSLFVGFPNRLNTSENKTLFEMGDPNIYHSRLKIFLWKYERLYFEITDSKYRKYSLSVDFQKWISTEIHFIHVNLNVEKKTMSLIVDDDIREEIGIPDLSVNKDFLNHGSAILGCSLNLSDPCPFKVAFHSTGASNENPTKYYQITKEYLDAVSPSTSH